MIIEKLKNSKIVLNTMKEQYSSSDICEWIRKVNESLEGIDIENKLIGLCLSDSFTQFILGSAIWDKKNVIMFIHSKNGKEYADKIIDHYHPHYVFMEKAYYEENYSNKCDSIKQFLVGSNEIVLCSLPNGNEGLKDRQGCIFFTSGTTDVPKAVYRSRENMVKDAESNIVSFDITSDDKLLVAVPFGHVYGLGSGVLPFAMQGATIYFSSNFASGRVLKRIIEENKITSIITSPTVYQELLTANVEVSSCRLMLSAGSKLSSKLAEDFYRKYNKIINNMYGSSETGAIATLYGDDVISTDTTNCGRPMYSISVFCDGTPEKEGVIKVKSTSVAEGVLIDNRIEPLTDAEGWFEMSDMGYIDVKGCIHLICRKDDMINIGGEKLNPKTIEKIAEKYFEQVLVLSHPNDDGNSYPFLYIEANEIDFPKLKDELVQRLSYKFIPKKIVLYTKFPRNNNGKIDRNQLREGVNKVKEYVCY